MWMNTCGTLRTLSRFLVVASLGIEVAAVAWADTALEYHTRGRDAFVKGNLELALAEFAKAIDADPELAVEGLVRASRYWRGVVYATKGLSEPAIADLDRFLERNPDEQQASKEVAWALYYRGLSHLRLKNYAQADTDLSQVVRYPVERVGSAVVSFAYNSRGNVLFGQGDLEAAVRDYTSAIQTQPQNAEAYYNRANVYRRSGRYQEAIADYTRVTVLTPRDPGAYHNRGVCYAGLAEWEKAVADYLQELRITPTYAGTYLLLAEAYIKLGLPSQAYEACKEVFDRKLVGSTDPNAQTTARKMVELAATGISIMTVEEAYVAWVRAYHAADGKATFGLFANVGQEACRELAGSAAAEAIHASALAFACKLLYQGDAAPAQARIDAKLKVLAVQKTDRSSALLQNADGDLVGLLNDGSGWKVDNIFPKKK